MINEERVKHMTRMAIYEKEKGPDYQQMLRYSKKDYVALHGWGGFVAGTLFFWILYATVVMYFLGEVIQNLSLMYLVLMGLAGLLCYAAYIVIHVYNVRRRAKKSYKKGRALIKKLGEQYTTLTELYAAEEALYKPKQVREMEEASAEDNDLY